MEVDIVFFYEWNETSAELLRMMIFMKNGRWYIIHDTIYLMPLYCVRSTSPAVCSSSCPGSVSSSNPRWVDQSPSPPSIDWSWCSRLFPAGCRCWWSSSWSWSTSSTVSEPTRPPPASPNSTLSTPTWWPASSWSSAPSWSTPSSLPSSPWSLIRRITTLTPRGQICGTKSVWFWTIPEDWTNSP